MVIPEIKRSSPTREITQRLLADKHINFLNPIEERIPLLNTSYVRNPVGIYSHEISRLQQSLDMYPSSQTHTDSAAQNMLRTSLALTKIYYTDRENYVALLEKVSSIPTPDEAKQIIQDWAIENNVPTEGLEIDSQKIHMDSLETRTNSFFQNDFLHAFFSKEFPDILTQLIDHSRAYVRAKDLHGRIEHVADSLLTLGRHLVDSQVSNPNVYQEVLAKTAESLGISIEDLTSAQFKKDGTLADITSYDVNSSEFIDPPQTILDLVTFQARLEKTREAVATLFSDIYFNTNIRAELRKAASMQNIITPEFLEATCPHFYTAFQKSGLPAKILQKHNNYFEIFSYNASRLTQQNFDGNPSFFDYMVTYAQKAEEKIEIIETVGSLSISDLLELPLLPDTKPDLHSPIGQALATWSKKTGISVDKLYSFLETNYFPTIQPPLLKNVLYYISYTLIEEALGNVISADANEFLRRIFPHTIITDPTVDLGFLNNDPRAMGSYKQTSNGSNPSIILDPTIAPHGRNGTPEEYQILARHLFSLLEHRTLTKFGSYDNDGFLFYTAIHEYTHAWYDALGGKFEPSRQKKASTISLTGALVEGYPVFTQLWYLFTQAPEDIAKPSLRSSISDVIYMLWSLTAKNGSKYYPLLDRDIQGYETDLFISYLLRQGRETVDPEETRKRIIQAQTVQALSDLDDGSVVLETVQGKTNEVSQGFYNPEDPLGNYFSLSNSIDANQISITSKTSIPIEEAKERYGYIAKYGAGLMLVLMLAKKYGVENLFDVLAFINFQEIAEIKADNEAFFPMITGQIPLPGLETYPTVDLVDERLIAFNQLVVESLREYTPDFVQYYEEAQ